MSSIIQKEKMNTGLVEQINDLPNFLVIGAMRAGTTSLHYNLARHPDVLMSKKKETNFFSDDQHWAQGVLWYQRQFRKTTSRCVGECSPSYTRRDLYPNVAKRIFLTLPNAKLIYLVRSPLVRSISHYVHSLVTMNFKYLPESVFKMDSEFLRESQYGYQMRPFLKLFPRKKIRVISSEAFWEDPYKVMRDVFDFLKIDTKFRHADFEIPLNQAAELPPVGFFHPESAVVLHTILARGYFLPAKQAQSLLRKLKRANSQFREDFSFSDRAWYDYELFRQEEIRYIKSIEKIFDHNFILPMSRQRQSAKEKK